MTYGVTSYLFLFFIDTIKTNVGLLILQLCVKDEQNRKNCWIFGNFEYKLLKL